MEKKILHIIVNDKFTSGYINFMMTKMEKYEHTFMVVPLANYELDLMDEEYYKKIIILNSMKELLLKKNKKIMINCNKIIVSGLFGCQKYLSVLPSKILKKTYLQFWGGDFYYYRNTNFFTKKNLHKFFLKRCIKKCYAVINLIPDDHNELIKIFPNNKKFFVGTMPNDPRRIKLYEKYDKNHELVLGRIIVGNSATRENHHIEVLKKLEYLKNENIEIICPLSYGDKEYAKEVIRTGKEIFKNKFIPLTEYMGFEEYLKLLLTCEIGIFNNDRQQALGNIYVLLRYGKKVYIRNNTSMWNNFKNKKIVVYDIDRVGNYSKKDLFYMDEKTKKSNHMNVIKIYQSDLFYWNNILDD